MKKLLQAKPDELSELLETTSRDEQAAAVKRLIAQAAAPVLDLVIRADTRTGQVTLHTIGANFPIAAAYAMLDEARKLLVEEERKAMKSASPEVTP